MSGAGETADAATSDVIRVEIEKTPDGLVKVARPGHVVARASQSLGDMVAGIRPVAQSFVDSSRGMAHAPDEIGVEFGLSLSLLAEADVVISRTAAQADFKVSLTWYRPCGDADTGTGTAGPSAFPAS
ncbi:CU044_2847 family protein [Streptomyces sp. ISL-10]|uniref:CU044_2847 family protein n=1 Tax=Streptomyces sp. ISL-10 TaxID=2819172 RepID=UPI0027E54002|nr:CU044_2847 family protein [Streptomyces sp. ISL-10]